MTKEEFEQLSFAEKVMAVVEKIPMCKVTTYGAIAAFCGAKRSARTVGWLLNSQKQRTDLPFHRVVNRMGILSGKQYFSSPTMMQELLEAEGIEVAENTVDLVKYFWQPVWEEM